ncbi:inositol 2-dehydrogenase [Salipaludibacillus sp. CF4.18]|uniref:inositol 2-dehydrogenase n=1 Tax=Salipaludibacillus sp. CF4.18 TaxID=3373081 RepID=UPI003EE56C14
MKTLTLGIIGAGRIGLLHANNILGSSNMRLKAIADVYVEQLNGTNIEEQVPVITKDPQDIFNDEEIDAVLICSSTDSHISFIKEAAKAGKHIFCEKPISFNIEDTKEILAIVEDAGVKFQVGFNRRFDKHFRKIHDLIEDGQIGNIHLIRISSRDPAPPPEEYVRRSGGMFMDMTIHDFDMMRYFSDSKVVDITVKAANLVDPMFGRHNDVDTAVITLTFENGSLGVIENSRESAFGYDQRVEVFGNLGSVAVENESETNIKVSKKENVYLDNPKHYFLERYKDAYFEEIQEFSNAILGDKAVICSGEDGYKAEQMASAAKRSWLENRTVRLDEVN